MPAMAVSLETNLMISCWLKGPHRSSATLFSEVKQIDHLHRRLLSGDEDWPPEGVSLRPVKRWIAIARRRSSQIA